MKQQTSSKRPTEFVAASTVVEGSVETDHNLRVRGAVEGGIVCAGLVTVEDDARVGAGIRARSVNVSGTVNGDVNVQDGTLKLGPTAVVNGNVIAGRLIVAGGARLNGRCRTIRSTEDPTGEQEEHDPFQSGSFRAA